MKDLCRTHWIERIDALARFTTIHSSIAACFDSITTEGSSSRSLDSLTDANTLLLAISTTDFLDALVITSHSLNYLLALTFSLQAVANDVVQAVAEINNLLTVLCDLRESIIASGLPKLRKCVSQKHRSNIPAENPKEYFRRLITIPILDHLLAEMETRFSKHQQTAINGIYLIPSIITTKSLGEITSKFTELEEMYGKDLPHSSSLQSEVHSWYLKWREQKEENGTQSLPTNLAFTLPHASAL